MSVYDRLNDWLNNHDMMNDKEYEEFFDTNYSRCDRHIAFINMAYTVATRSPDSQTQHGAILTRNDRIISTGYNGWPAGFPDDIIPNIRPYKYPFVIHAEHNAILNCAKNGLSVDGATLYVTGPPCHECSKILVQCGVKTWYIGETIHSTYNDPMEKLLRDFWVKYGHVETWRMENERFVKSQI